MIWGMVRKPTKRGIYYGLHCTGWGILWPTGISMYVGVVTEPTWAYEKLLKYIGK